MTPRHRLHPPRWDMLSYLIMVVSVFVVFVIGMYTV